MSKVLIDYLSEKELHTVKQVLINMVSYVPYIYDRTLENFKDTTLKRKNFKEFAERIYESTQIEILDGIACTIFNGIIVLFLTKHDLYCSETSLASLE